jgi:hypothetical protein
VKTSDLIAALAAADPRPVRQANPTAPVAAAAGIGVAAAVAVLALWLGFQSLAHAFSASWFWMKAGYSLALALAGFLLLVRAVRPGARLGLAWLVVGGLALGAIGMMAAHSSMRTPADRQMALWLGSTWRVCPGRILALAIPTYVAIALSVRRLAPTRLGLAGAAAGLIAGGLAAAVYGLYCLENTAPFTAAWYSAGIAACALIGGALGSRLLRW